jgi:PP-loop family
MLSRWRLLGVRRSHTTSLSVLAKKLPLARVAKPPKHVPKPFDRALQYPRVVPARLGCEPVTAAEFSGVMKEIIATSQVKLRLQDGVTPICVAVSGSAESMVLTAMLADWCLVNPGFRLYALIIDHTGHEPTSDGLKVVTAALTKLRVGIVRRSQPWGPATPKLRLLRYALLEEMCREVSSSCVLLCLLCDGCGRTSLQVCRFRFPTQDHVHTSYD